MVTAAEACLPTMHLPDAPPNAPADPLIGMILAERYRVTGRLGAGGMGAVYLGEHIALRKRVAIKVLHASRNVDAEMVRRFQQEAVASAHLEHPNIAAASDLAQLPDGALFLVMEYVEGRPLRVLLGAPLDPHRAVDLLGQVGAALSHAHAKGVVHRDLKPENVVVSTLPDGREAVKVIDFGIARITAPEMRAGATVLTQMGMIMGTPQYMSPEQTLGQPADAAADQYALGVMAFELFTGRVPFVAAELCDLLGMHVGAPVPRVTELTPSLPPALADAVARMMAKRPVERFPSVQCAIDALRAALEPIALSPEPVAPVAPPVAPVASALRRVPIRARVAVVALAAALLAAPWLFGSSEPSPADTQNSQPVNQAPAAAVASATQPADLRPEPERSTGRGPRFGPPRRPGRRGHGHH